MRLFVAIELPENIRIKLSKIQTKFNSVGKLKFVKEFHLTLCFLGEVAESSLEEIVTSLKKIEFEPFFLNLECVGCFPNSNHIQVIWAGLQHSEELNTLAKRVNNVLGNPFKGFKPHLTLARVKINHDKEKLINILNSIKIEPKSFRVGEFKLIQSNLMSKGLIYTVLETFNCNN